MLASCLFVQEESSPDRHEVEDEDEAVDALGIPGWDELAKAKALIELEGLAVSASQAQDIQRLYDRLGTMTNDPSSSSHVLSDLLVAVSASGNLAIKV